MREGKIIAEKESMEMENKIIGLERKILSREEPLHRITKNGIDDYKSKLVEGKPFEICSENNE